MTYDILNRLAIELCRVARRTGRQALAAEVFSYVPVNDEVGFFQFKAHFGVVRSLLRLRPAYTRELRQAFDRLSSETVVVEQALRKSWMAV